MSTGWGVAGHEGVPMGIDEAWHEDAAAAGDRSDIVADVDRIDGYALDRVAPDEQVGRWRKIGSVAVENPHILEQGRTFCCRRGNRV